MLRNCRFLSLIVVEHVLKFAHTICSNSYCLFSATFKAKRRVRRRLLEVVETVSVAPPAEPRGEKKLFFVQILGGEKLLKFGETWAVKNVLVGLRGLNIFQSRFGSFFGSFFAFFKPSFASI